MERICTSASELNLLIKMANLIDDAVKIKTGQDSLVLAMNDGDRIKKVVTAGVLDTLKGLGKALTAQGLTAAKVAAILTALYGTYAGTKRAGNKVREWFHLDPDKRGNLPDPYENIDVPDKFKDIKNRSREVSPGYYAPEATSEAWFSEAEKNKFWDAGKQTGIPANFGIAPGFAVGKPKPSAFSDANKELRSVSKVKENKLVVLSQSGGFANETIDSMSDANKLNPDIAGWVNPTNFEQFLSQGAGQWAASPSAESAFYDPSGQLMRSKPIEIKAPGAGQDFAVVDPLAYKQGRLEAFNEAELQRESAKVLWRLKQINLLEQRGAITPQQAAQDREAINMVLQMNPEIGSQVNNMVQNYQGEAFDLPGQAEFQPGMTNEEINWEDRSDPLEQAKHKLLMEKALGAMDKYQDSNLYQNTLEQSPTLSQ